MKTKILKEQYCVACGKQIKDKNTIGINKKLISKDTTSFYCMDCLANYLSCMPQDILDKIEEFKDEGCKLFE